MRNRSNTSGLTLNRLDEIIVFRQLTKDEKQSLRLCCEKFPTRLAEQGIALEANDSKTVVEEGYNPSYGADHCVGLCDFGRFS